MLGALLMIMGLILTAVIIGVWVNRGFGALSEERVAVLAAALFIIGVQIFFSSFLLSILGLRRTDRPIEDEAQLDSRKLDASA
jgi:hypothetical protein